MKTNYCFVLDKKKQGRAPALAEALLEKADGGNSSSFRKTQCGNGVLGYSNSLLENWTTDLPSTEYGYAVLIGNHVSASDGADAVARLILENKKKSGESSSSSYLIVLINLDDSISIKADVTGEIPFAYIDNEEFFILSRSVSDFSAIRQFGFTFNLDRQAFDEFIFLGSYPTSKSPFIEIKKILPGSGVTISSLGVKLLPPKRLLNDAREIANVNEEAMYPELSRSLKKAITNRQANSGTATVLLSAGMDSACVAATAAECFSQVTAVSVSSLHALSDETSAAEKIARSLGIRFEKVVVGDLSIREVEEIYADTHEPYGFHSLIPTYFGTKAAASISKTVLTGDGGDGYFGPADAQSAAATFQHWDAAHSRFSSIHQLPIALRLFIYRIAKFYIARKSLDGIDPTGRPSIFKDVFAACFEDWTYLYLGLNPSGKLNFPGSHPLSHLKNIYKMLALSGDSLPDHAEARLHWYFNSAVLPKVLTCLNRVNAEGIFPLLEGEVATFSNKLSIQQKTGKSFLKRYLSSVFRSPEINSIFDRNKHGFGFPVRRLLRGDTYHRDVLERIVESQLIADLGYRKSDFEKLFGNTLLLGKYDKRAWHLFCAAVWYEKFVR